MGKALELAGIIIKEFIFLTGRMYIQDILIKIILLHTTKVHDIFIQFDKFQGKINVPFQHMVGSRCLHNRWLR